MTSFTVQLVLWFADCFIDIASLLNRLACWLQNFDYDVVSSAVRKDGESQ